MGNRLPDRESRVDAFFFAAAEAAPDLSFVLGGSGWHDKPAVNELDNVNDVGHVYTREVVALLRDLSPQRAATIGAAARQRVLRDHTYDHRAEQLEALLAELVPAAAGA